LLALTKDSADLNTFPADSERSCSRAQKQQKQFFAQEHASFFSRGSAGHKGQTEQ
jgi:hypothetical protein